MTFPIPTSVNDATTTELVDCRGGTYWYTLKNVDIEKLSTEGKIYMQCRMQKPECTNNDSTDLIISNI